MKKILLTGFECFQGESINPSQLIVQKLSQANPELVDGLVLPVSYGRSFGVLKSQLDKVNYDFVLMLGQASARKNIGLERVAINLMDADIADEDQVLQREQKISPQGSDAILNELPLRQWLQTLKSENFPGEISNSAGTFVCNALYYQMLSELKKNQRHCQALFVHVPYELSQAVGKPSGTPSLSLEVMLRTVVRLIELIGEKKS